MTTIGGGRFELRRELGRGGMGVVWEAFDHSLRTPVAVKQLLNVNGDNLSRFKGEFRGLVDIAHPNLVRLRELFCDGEGWFFTMELVDGVDVLRWVRGEAGVLDEARLRTCLVHLARGLHTLHTAGKVHRDIKPQNILVRQDGTCVILDFGLAVDDSLSLSRQEIAGTLAYMAPEQADEAHSGAPADWYALGVVLYEALTGQLPFLASGLRVLLEKQERDPPPPSQIYRGVPRDLETLCMELLRRDPAGRPSGKDVLARLEPDAVPEEVSSSLSGVFGVRTSQQVFVGRLEEQRWLQRAYADAGQDGPVVAFVRGDSGVGKSLLVRRFLADLRDGIAPHDLAPLVLTGRCYERESVPFKALDGVVDDLTRHLLRIDPVEAASLLPREIALVARLFPVLRRSRTIASAPAPREIVAPHDQRAAAFSGLRELVHRIAERRPLVLFVDDLQWADADSAALLEELLRPPGAPRLLLVATLRTDRGGGDAPYLTRLLDKALPGVRRLDVGTLPDADSRQLVEELLACEAPHLAIHAADLARESGGHPMFLHELVRHVSIEGAGAGTSKARLDEALWHRVSRLDPGARRIMETLAVAGVPTPLETLATAVDQTFAACDQALSVLRVAYLVRATGARSDLRFSSYHDRVREAVLARLDDETTRHLSRRMADALEATGLGNREAVALVRHLEVAGQLERAARRAAEAAEQALDGLAFDAAADLFGTALRLGGRDRPEAWPLELRRGDALVGAGRGSEAAEAFLAAARWGTAGDKLQARRRAAEQLLVAGHIERGLAVLGDVLAETGMRLPARGGPALRSFLWQRTKLRLRGIRWRPRHPDEISSASRHLLEVYQALATGMALVDTLQGSTFQARGLLLALRTGHPFHVIRGLGLEAGYIATRGKSNAVRARALVGEARRLAAEDGSPPLLAFTEGAAGLVEYLLGAFRAASEQCRVAEASLQAVPFGMIWELNTARYFRLLALRLQGQYGELDRLVTEYLRDAARRGDKFAATTFARACNVVWLARGEPDEARAWLERAGWAPPEGGFHLQHWYELRAGIELALHAGNGDTRPFEDRFRALSASHLLRVQTLRTEHTWLVGRLGLARGDSAGLSAASRSAAALRREGVPYASAWSALLSAGLAARRGDPSRTLSELDRATILARQADLASCAGAAIWLSGRLQGGTQGAARRHGAEAELRALGVARPADIVRVLVPGVPEDGS